MEDVKWASNAVSVSDWCNVILLLNWWPELNRIINDRWVIREIIHPEMPSLHRDTIKFAKLQRKKDFMWSTEGDGKYPSVEETQARLDAGDDFIKKLKIVAENNNDLDTIY